MTATINPKDPNAANLARLAHEAGKPYVNVENLEEVVEATRRSGGRRR